MRSFAYLFIFLFLLCVGRGQAQFLAKPVLELALSGNVQKDDFNWSIAGTPEGRGPNILSELIWRNLRGPAISADIRATLWRGLFIESSYSQSQIIAGEASDTDYFGDDRSSPGFSAKLRSDRGGTNRFSAGLGYRVPLTGNLQLQPSVGYSFQGQKLYLLDDIPESRLNSTYQAAWRGAYAKLEAGLKLPHGLRLEVAGSYHQLNYKAEADWNTIEEFQHPVSFRHTAKGYALEGEIIMAKSLGRRFSVFLNAGIFSSATGAGVDEVFLSDGKSNSTKLNEAKRNSYDYGPGINCRF